MRRTAFSLLLLALLFAVPSQAKVTRYLTGNAADVVVSLTGPAHDFGGGGTDIDAALQWIIDQVRGCTSCSTKIDVVILRSSGADGQPATDPGVMFRQPRGALTTFGEHKGYALALICEILGGALTGGGTMRPENQAAATTTKTRAGASRGPHTGRPSWTSRPATSS